jgi:hypothetical protein
MLSSYDEFVRHSIESALAPYGGGLMEKIDIPGGSPSYGQTTRRAYAWIIELSPEIKAKILAGGFSLMALALAVRETSADQDTKNRLMRAAILEKRKGLAIPPQPKATQPQTRSQSQPVR